MLKYFKLFIKHIDDYILIYIFALLNLKPKFMSNEFDINFDDLGLDPIHPQDYCLKIFSNSGEVYWHFCRKGVPIQPNLIEERIFKTFVSVANKKINYEKDR